MSNWPRVNAKRRCPCCGKPDWCMIAPDGTACICARVQSDKPVGNKGAGWLHVISERPKTVSDFKPAPRKETWPTRNWPEFHSRCVMALPDNDALAESLGVAEWALGALEMGWSREHAAYTFPMRDGRGKIIGIRTRCRTGAKLAVKGSQNGLFIPRGKPDKELWICEGPTDCAALLTLGKFAIGRPSNTGGMDHLIDYCRHRYTRLVVIMADRDAKPHAEELTMNAAHELATRISAMRRKVKIVRPQLGHKDIRSWLCSGLTSAALTSIVNDYLYWGEQ